MKRILHITPHLGGGVGAVVTALVDGLVLSGEWHQEIVCFEYLNAFGKEWSEKNGITVYSEVNLNGEWLHNIVSEVDIVHVHYWNHPLLYCFLHSMSGNNTRMVFWSHTNGHNPPYLLNSSVLDYPEIFVLSSGFSLESEILKKRNRRWKDIHLRVVHSSSGIKGFDRIKPRKHTGFNIGYVGTVDYCKMHRDFIKICNKIDIPNLNIIICGGNCHLEIEEEAKSLGLSDKFDFRGPVDDVKEVFAELDVFIYPLNSDNYGTGEQVLIEAMSASVPQVVFDNGPESHVVQDGYTGFVAKNASEMAKSVEKLYHSQELRQQIGVNSRKWAVANYSIEYMVDDWSRIYKELLQRNRKNASLLTRDSKIDDSVPLSLFLLALGECEERSLYEMAIKHFPDMLPASLKSRFNILRPVFTGQTRGSVKHYANFCEDARLKYLAECVSEWHD